MCNSYKKIMTILVLIFVFTSCNAEDNNKQKVKTIGLLIFPGFELLDVFGPVEMFGAIPDKVKVVLIGTSSGNIKSNQGTSILVDTDINHAPMTDIILVPGGQGIRTEVKNLKLQSWLRDRAASAELVLSVCTGSALLAKAGILDNHKATSNKSVFDWVTTQGPHVNWVKKARWVEDGKFITSSGVSAGTDMSLYVINKLYGSETLHEVETYTEYTFINDSTNDKFSKAN